VGNPKTVTPIFTDADKKAAEDLGIQLTSELLTSVKSTLKGKAAIVVESVQYYALLRDDIWQEDELRLRLYGATRLLHEYSGPAGIGVSERNLRIKKLEDLIFQLTRGKLENLPLVQKIKERRGL